MASGAQLGPDRLAQALRRWPRGGGRTSSSESVRSCAWNVSRSASDRRPGPSASASRQTSKTWASLSSSPPASRAASSTALAGCSSATTTAMSWRSGGNSESGSARGGLAQPLAQPVEVELHARRRDRRSRSAGAVSGCSSPTKPSAGSPGTCTKPLRPGCRNGSRSPSIAATRQVTPTAPRIDSSTPLPRKNEAGSPARRQAAPPRRPRMTALNVHGSRGSF